MRTPARILVVDDNAANVDILKARLENKGYEVMTAGDGAQGLAIARAQLPDLILLDVMMPKIDGLEVCNILKADTSLPFMPIILVTAKTDTKDVVAGLDSGADDYLTKPYNHAALLARVRSMLRIKALHDTVEAQSAELSELNRTLETRVSEQVEQIDRMNRLKHFLAPGVADLIIASGDESLLESHRSEVTVVFGDLRGFTSFTETAEPEDVTRVLLQYHEALGPLIDQSEGTVERFIGDGLLILFNDPMPVADHTVRAVRMAVSMRDAIATLSRDWARAGHKLGFGLGITLGHATLGRVGYKGRFCYSATGSVVNLAARLSDAATDGQILVSERVCAAVEDIARAEPMADMALKGLHGPTVVYNVLDLKPGA